MRIILRTVLVAGIASVLYVAPFTLRIVTGGSMSPALLPGDLCMIREGSVGMGRGDIVLFDKSGWPGGVLHRVQAVLPGGRLRTRGDANPVPDLDPVSASQIVGRCVLVVPSGRALHFLGSLSGGRLRAQPHSPRR